MSPQEGTTCTKNEDKTMTIEFANYIYLVPREDVESIADGVVTLKTGKTLDLILADNDLVLGEETAEEKGNPYYAQSLKVVSEKLTADLSARYRNHRLVIAMLPISDGTTIIWGDLSVPVRVTLTPKLDRDVLDFSRASADSLL